MQRKYLYFFVRFKKLRIFAMSFTEVDAVNAEAEGWGLHIWKRCLLRRFVLLTVFEVSQTRNQSENKATVDVHGSM